MYCKQTFIRDDFISWSTEEKLVRDEYFSRPRFIHTRFDITPIQQRLVRSEKYSQRRGSDKIF